MAPTRVVDYAGARAQVEHDLFDTFKLEALIDITPEQFNIVFSRLKAEPPPQNDSEEMAMKRNLVSWLQRSYPHLKDKRRMPTTRLVQDSMTLKAGGFQEMGITPVVSNNDKSEAAMRQSRDNVGYNEGMPAWWAARNASRASASPTALTVAAVQFGTHPSIGKTKVSQLPAALPFDDETDDEVDNMSVTYTATEPVLQPNASPDSDFNIHLGGQCDGRKVVNIVQSSDESDSDSLFVPTRSSNKAELASSAASVVESPRAYRAQSVVSASAAQSIELFQDLIPPPVPRQSHPRILRSTSRIQNATEGQPRFGSTAQSSTTHVSEGASSAAPTTSMARRPPNSWVEEPMHQERTDALVQGTGDSVVNIDFPTTTLTPSAEECNTHVLAGVPTTLRIIEAHVRDGRTKDALEGLAEVFSKVWFVNAANASAAQ